MLWPKYWDEEEADLLLIHASGGTEAWHDATEEFPMKPPSSGKRLWLIHGHVPVNRPPLMCSMEWYTVDEVREFIRPLVEEEDWEIERDELSRCLPQRKEAVPVQFDSKGGQTEGEASVTVAPPNQAARTAEDVYWDYVEKHGLDVAQHAVIAYFEPETVVEILLDQIDGESLDDFLHDNLTERLSSQSAEQPTEQSMDD